MRDHERTHNADTPILRFYRGAGTDHRGRSLDEILRWNDEALEDVHDFIQWLFPLDEPSQFNPDAPLVSRADRVAFLSDAALSATVRRALERMLAFYGFRLRHAGGRSRVERAANWSERADAWLHPGNHNYLRLTRIMKSLKLLGMPELARALYETLTEESRRAAHGRIGATTLHYWRAAVED